MIATAAMYAPPCTKIMDRAASAVSTLSRQIQHRRPSLSDRAAMMSRPAALATPVKDTAKAAAEAVSPRSMPRSYRMGTVRFQVALMKNTVKKKIFLLQQLILFLHIQAIPAEFLCTTVTLLQVWAYLTAIHVSVKMPRATKSSAADSESTF